MKTFRVTAAVPVFMTVTVEAEDEDSAIDTALEAMTLTAFAGNNGMDKLVGTRESNVSLEVNNEAGVIECGGFSIEVEEE